jgi:hypothetical protein
MRDPLALAPFDAGLTNQKLALVGLALRARAEDRPVVLAPLVDYRPGASAQVEVSFASVFDLPSLAGAFAAFGVAIAEGQAEKCDGGALLGIGGEAIAVARRTRDDATFGALCTLLAGMAPAPSIARTAEEIGKSLAARGVNRGCQFRIERDWLHWTMLHRADERVDAAEPLYIDYQTILAKLADAPGSGPIYVTCNEDDLPVGKAEILRYARSAHGLNLVFRSEFPAAPTPGLLVGAALDFAIASTLPWFAGHTRSTFFGALALTAHGAGRSSQYWFYNNRGPMLKQRADHGAFVRPWAAANL